MSSSRPKCGRRFDPRHAPQRPCANVSSHKLDKAEDERVGALSATRVLHLSRRDATTVKATRLTAVSGAAMWWRWLVEWLGCEAGRAACEVHIMFVRNRGSNAVGRSRPGPGGVYILEGELLFAGVKSMRAPRSVYSLY